MKQTRQGKFKNVCGSRIREARLKAKPQISQENLAGKMAALGVLLDRSAVSRIESRSRGLLDYKVQSLARCLKPRSSKRALSG